MAYRLVEETTTRVPAYAVEHRTRVKQTAFGPVTVSYTASTKVPTGQYFDVTHKIWRCSHCRAMACGTGAPPEICGKCKNR